MLKHIRSGARILVSALAVVACTCLPVSQARAQRGATWQTSVTYNGTVYMDGAVYENWTGVSVPPPTGVGLPILPGSTHTLSLWGGNPSNAPASITFTFTWVGKGTQPSTLTISIAAGASGGLVRDQNSQGQDLATANGNPVPASLVALGFTQTSPTNPVSPMRWANDGFGDTINVDAWSFACSSTDQEVLTVGANGVATFTLNNMWINAVCTLSPLAPSDDYYGINVHAAATIVSWK